MDWFLEVAPPEDDHTTSYTPGDLFDLLSTSTETRFHAGHLFMRYFHLVSCVDEDEEQEALEAVTWDLAVACLALSVKFHRDVLFPLDVIYAQEFLELAPHAMEFADLENAQRDVLEALSYRIGSATPGAFMEELSEALPTLRKLVGFDGGWDGVQKKAWDVLCDALQQQDLLRFPLSVLTATAIMEGVLDVLVKRYRSTGTDGRGKPCKRDSGSLRKAAVKCSRGARLDVQEVLQISDEELFACQKWLGVYVESK
ncbi:hypothetical protein LXA43DRAFT_339367 [Ganoderma leucocontextum]|nr:hypothetical protein LXA43DRAFT_339367 [Ganoderma leucocontextum]